MKRKQVRTRLFHLLDVLDTIDDHLCEGLALIVQELREIKEELREKSGNG